MTSSVIDSAVTDPLDRLRVRRARVMHAARSMEGRRLGYGDAAAAYAELRDDLVHLDNEIRRVTLESRRDRGFERLQREQVVQRSAPQTVRDWMRDETATGSFSRAPGSAVR